MTTKLNWGVLATGSIAHTFARALAHSKTGRLVAVGSRTAAAATAFGQQYGVTACHGSYEALLGDPHVDAVYIATPHPQHVRWAIRCAEAGKHVLCEKPAGLNAAEAMASIEAAERHDVFFMEAFMYRCHPQTQRLVDLVRAAAIGDVRLIVAHFGFRAADDEASRIMNNALGGGGILDVGCYPVSLARLIAGAALGRDFADPIDVQAFGRLHPVSGVDAYAVANLRFEGDILAQVGTAVRLGLDNQVVLYGTEGRITVSDPWIPAREGGRTTILVEGQGRCERVNIRTRQWLYAIEADTVARHLARRQATAPAMSWADTMGNMHTLDRWREAIGLVYEAEKPENNAGPMHGRPLAVRRDAKMPAGHVAGVTRPVSRLVLGCDNQRTMPHAAAMFDDFFERGGNAFDTAYIYGGGLLERLLGRWVASRGIREQVVLIDKGAHTPDCWPHMVRGQLEQSLDRLGTDHVDLYLLHRDNDEVPAGEFVDALDELRREGLLRAYGGSNWPTDRVDAANAWARDHDRSGFAAVSNNFSLARMVAPVWEGCLSSAGPAARAWHTETQLPLLAWSSQARGFFVHADPADRSDPQLARCWYSDANFARLQRARKLAHELNVAPTNIALAYVLCQPFPTFALIGPRTLGETRTTWPALNVSLTADQLAWLDGDEDRAG